MSGDVFFNSQIHVKNLITPLLNSLFGWTHTARTSNHMYIPV